MVKYFCIILVVLVSASCTEEFPVDFPEREPKLVVEAVVTDQPGPYYVRLTLSKSTFASQNYNDTINEQWLFDGFEPVLGAKVIISDSKGTIDTLVNSPDSIYGFYRIIDGMRVDSVLTINPQGHFLGYYQTRKLKGKPGNTYHLKIKWNNREYSSTCFMPPVPSIDSVTYSFTEGAPGKFNYYIPQIWFKDNPKTKDYYLFTGIGGVTNGITLNDELINEKVSGLDVFKGVWLEWWTNSYPMPGMYYKIELNSVTKELYDYYNALVMQVRNDGGVYSPSPASPPSNISNGALGYFRASAVQIVEDTLPDFQMSKSHIVSDCNKLK